MMTEAERKAMWAEVVQTRYLIGADILLKMKEEDDLPLPNKRRVAKVMQEYFKQEGHVDTLKEQNYRWRPTIDYWHNHLDDVRKYMREKKHKFFSWVPSENGGFKGEWRFVQKKDGEEVLKRKNNELSTRVENFNDERNGAPWDSKVPAAGDIPKLN